MATKLGSGPSASKENMCLTAASAENVVAVGYENGFVRLWDVRCDLQTPMLTGRCAPPPTCPNGDVSSLIFGNQNAEHLHVAAGRYLYFQDLRKTTEAGWTVPRFDVNEDDVNQIAISENDEVLATADDNHEVVLIDLPNSRLLARLKKHKNVAYTVQFRPGKPRELMSGGYDCRLIHWDILKSRILSSADVTHYSDPEWNLPQSFNPSYVLCCAFATLTPGDTKNTVLVAGSGNGNLHCFRCDKNVIHFRSFRAHQLGVTQTTYLRRHSNLSGSTNMLVTGGNDGQIHFWNLNVLFGGGTSGEDESDCQAAHTISHDDKINWICEMQEDRILICDTSLEASLVPLPI